MSYAIEDNVPLPPPGEGRVTLPAVLRQMKPGQSVLVTDRKRESVLSQVAAMKRAYPATKWTTRRTEEGVRVWRIA